MGLKEFVLTADWIARGALYFLLFAAKYFSTSAFLISITASPIIRGLLGRLSSRAIRGELKAKGQQYRLQNTLYMISVRLALCFALISYGRLESQISAFDDVVASQQPPTMSAADAKPNLLRLCAYVSGLQTNHMQLFFLSPDQRSLWWMTAQLPFEAYDQTTRKILRFLAFSCPLLRSRRASIR